jgi:twitching motility protein PilT
MRITGRSNNVNIDEMLRLMVEKGASDLHLRVPSPPIIRVDGHLESLDGLTGIMPQDMEEALENITTETERETFHEELELDLAYSIHGLSRFRVNVSLQRGTINLAFRQIPVQIPTIDELGLPDVCKMLVLKPKGLVLVTGPTGSGKSTTLAAMIDHLNKNESRNVITVEDPIEYLHSNDKCIIAQRELGDDTKSFTSALKHVLRQDPDVVLVGEMRDLESIATAITAAETGHLVLSTLHTPNAPQTIDRIIDVFPPHQQTQVRTQLALALEGVLSQILLPKANGGGRVAVFEVMLATDAIRNLIREGKTEQIPTYIQTSGQNGMNTMDQHLDDLSKSGVITWEEASVRMNRSYKHPAEVDRQSASPEGNPVKYRGFGKR